MVFYIFEPAFICENFKQREILKVPVKGIVSRDKEGGLMIPVCR
jgi:hypothetical protein